MLWRKTEAFVDTFHKGDAKALAAFWTPDGDQIDQNGRQLKGREAFEAAFKELFSANKGLKLRADSESLRFVNPDVAIEDGVTEVIPTDGGPPTRARYTIVHVKMNGVWQISSLRNATYLAHSGAGQLQGLSWIVGDWVGERKKGEVERLALGWTETQSFLVGTFSTTARDVSLGSAHVWIGWDPLSKTIRSWSFDDTGAFGEGSWITDGKRSLVKTTSVLPDGKKATVTLVISPVDANTISLQAKDRNVGDERLPDVPEVTLKRVK